MLIRGAILACLAALPLALAESSPASALPACAVRISRSVAVDLGLTNHRSKHVLKPLSPARHANLQTPSAYAQTQHSNMTSNSASACLVLSEKLWVCPSSITAEMRRLTHYRDQERYHDLMRCPHPKP